MENNCLYEIKNNKRLSQKQIHKLIYFAIIVSFIVIFFALYTSNTKFLLLIFILALILPISIIKNHSSCKEIKLYSDELYIISTIDKRISYKDIKAIKQCDKYIYLIINDNYRKVTKKYKNSKEIRHIYNDFIKLPNVYELYSWLIKLNEDKHLESLNIDNCEYDGNQELFNVSQNKINYRRIIERSLILAFFSFMLIICALTQISPITAKLIDSFLTNKPENMILSILLLNVVTFQICKKNYLSDYVTKYILFNSHIQILENQIVKNIPYSNILEIIIDKPDYTFSLSNSDIKVLYILPDSKKVEHFRLNLSSQADLENLKISIRKHKTM